MRHERKFRYAQRLVWAPTHVDSQWACDLFCSIMEDVAPGFTDATNRQIAARIAGDRGQNNLAWADAMHVAYFRRKRPLHELALRIACWFVERHDPMPKGGR